MSTEQANSIPEDKLRDQQVYFLLNVGCEPWWGFLTFVKHR